MSMLIIKQLKVLFLLSPPFSDVVVLFPAPWGSVVRAVMVVVVLKVTGVFHWGAFPQEDCDVHGDSFVSV